jgi:PEP-CTERM motif
MIGKLRDLYRLCAFWIDPWPSSVQPMRDVKSQFQGVRMRYSRVSFAATMSCLASAFTWPPAFRRSRNDVAGGYERKGNEMAIRKLTLGGALGLALLLGFLRPALADSMSHFSFTYADGSHILSFDLPTDPSPSFFSNVSFGIESVAVLVDGVAETGVAEFFTSGAFGFDDLTLQVDAGFASIFNGPTSAPSFEDGSYVYTQGSAGTLVITSTAAPEPSTWAMLLIGFAGLGFAGYRARRPTAIGSRA